MPSRGKSINYDNKKAENDLNDYNRSSQRIKSPYSKERKQKDTFVLGGNTYDKN